MKRKLITFIILFISTALPSMDMSINKSIRVKNGDKQRHDCITINGNIKVGDNSKVMGSCRTVNGNIYVGTNSTVKKLQTVNGNISIDKDTKIFSNIQSVNGSVTCASNVFVRRNIQTINGPIGLDNTRVKKDITTHNGDITLDNGSVVGHNIIIKKSDRHKRRKTPLNISLSGNSIVEGDNIVKDKNLEVFVFIEDGSKVMGEIKNAKIIND